MSYYIDRDKCLGCGACAASCPIQCINLDDNVYSIDEEQCLSCGNCNNNCPISLPKER